MTACAKPVRISKQDLHDCSKGRQRARTGTQLVCGPAQLYTGLLQVHDCRKPESESCAYSAFSQGVYGARTVSRRCFCCGLLSLFVGFQFVLDLLFASGIHLLEQVWCSSSGKSLVFVFWENSGVHLQGKIWYSSSGKSLVFIWVWLSACYIILHVALGVCVSVQFHVWGGMAIRLCRFMSGAGWLFDCIVS